MPGETDPVASGYTLSNGVWYKDGLSVTPSGVSEFRIVNGNPYWKYRNQYYYNSMNSYTATAWGYSGPCTQAGATCFFVSGHQVFYMSGATCHYNDLTTYAFASSSWGNDGPCAPSTASGIQVIDGALFYTVGTTYYYNDLIAFTAQPASWGYGGSCTQSGASSFRVSGGFPYWNISSTHYYNNLTSFNLSPAYWGTINTYSSGLPAPDTAYNICDYAYIVPPPIPTANSASGVTSGGFTANWSTASGATGYYLDVSANSGFPSFLAGFNNLDVGNVVSRNVTGLSASTTYYYRVRAYDSAGTSGNSTTISVTTAAPPSPPTIASPTILTSGNVGLPYSQSLSASGGVLPYVWSITTGGLPAGLSLSGSGVVSGTPQNTTNDSFTLQVTGSNGLYSSAAFDLSILGAIPPTMVSALIGTNLYISWPTNYLGWELQTQTNSLAVGLSTNWVSITNSTLVTATNIPVYKWVPAQFFRMHFQ